MKIAVLHPWDLSAAEAVRLQRELAPRVVRAGNLAERDVRHIAGADVAFDRPNRRGVGAVVVLAWPSLEVVERVTVEMPVTFPYVPGLLSFREAPVLLAAMERVETRPDLLFIDGHGYAHPRRFGLACHVGMLLALPTIGIAKSRLVGEAEHVGPERGSRGDLVHEGEIIGSLLRTKGGVRPVYVSVGHGLSLGTAEAWTLRCAPRYRVPEPTRLADKLAGEAKRRMLDATLEIVIEQRAGEEGRWEWKADTDEVVFERPLEPMRTHYGCSVDTINPADGELLDVMLLDDRPYARGQRTWVRVVDVLRKADGDDKLLAVAVDREWPEERRIAQVREEVFAWYVRQKRPVTHWGGEDEALELLRSLA